VRMPAQRCSSASMSSWKSCWNEFYACERQLERFPWWPLVAIVQPGRLYHGELQVEVLGYVAMYTLFKTVRSTPRRLLDTSQS